MLRLLPLLLLAAALCRAQAPSIAAQRARPAPDWLTNGVLYQLWLRSFTPEGTLRAATARLPHVAELGVTTLYLSPLPRMSTTGGFTNPYRQADFDTIDPEYGTLADLQAFTAAAHRLGLRVVLDVVFYHTGPDHVLLTQHPEWYYRRASGEVQLGTWGLPRLDFRHAGLRDHLTASLVRWVREAGVDGFRCDVAAGIPLEFWAQVRAALDRVRPGLALIAESDLPAEQVQVFDANYNFPWYETLVAVVANGEPATRLAQTWERMRATFPQGARLLRLNDNHDRDRADVVFGRKGALATAALNLTLDGLPLLYNGQEIGDTTPTDHQSRVPIRWDRQRAQAKTFALYQRLIALRRQEPALTQGDVIWLGNSEPTHVVSYVRRHGNDEVLVVVNLSNRALSGTVDLPVADYQTLQDLLNGQRRSFPMAPGRVSWTLGAFEFLVLKRPGT